MSLLLVDTRTRRRKNEIRHNNDSNSTTTAAVVVVNRTERQEEQQQQYFQRRRRSSLLSLTTTTRTTTMKMICFISMLLMMMMIQLEQMVVEARPVVRSITSAREFERLLKKHGTETGLPVVVDYYSDSCGPCRMMAPIYKQVAADYVDRAVFVKVDTQVQREISGKYQIRSLPTFHWFIGGQIVEEQKGGIGEGPLRQITDKHIRQATLENVEITLDALITYYQSVDPNKSEKDITTVHKKCADMFKKIDSSNTRCFGAPANQLSRRLRQKYKSIPKTIQRFTDDDQKSGTTSSSSSNTGSGNSGGAGSSSTDSSSESKSSNRRSTTPTSSPSSNRAADSSTTTANLHLATKEQLLEELERRKLADGGNNNNNNEEEEEEEDDDDTFIGEPYFPSSSSPYPEPLVIIGGGPAGMSAAIYGARAGLRPIVIAPSVGGQLQGKGVDVENYPALYGGDNNNVTGPSVVKLMRKQAAHFGTMFLEDIVTAIETTTTTGSSNNDGSPNPIIIKTNYTEHVIRAHSVIIATGAESNWLNIRGEYELRGGGVSSCATCDGFLYSNQNVIVIGGGDSAMEDALVLARTSKLVTVIHRRDVFRASKILAQRVLHHPNIHVVWNTTVQEIIGKHVRNNDSQDSNDSDDDEEEVDLDNVESVVSGVVLQNVATGETTTMSCDAVFVAIGHTPNTHFLRGVVEFNPQHPGYLLTQQQQQQQSSSSSSSRRGHSYMTQTSYPGIFAAGDVTDAVYRQAITSAGSGASAALDAERYLSEHGLGNEAAALEDELLAELLNDDGNSNRHNNNEEEAEEYNIYDDAGGRVHGMKESLQTEL